MLMRWGDLKRVKGKYLVDFVQPTQSSRTDVDLKQWSEDFTKFPVNDVFMLTYKEPELTDPLWYKLKLLACDMIEYMEHSWLNLYPSK